MLTQGDIELINEWRGEMLANRERPVSVTYVGKRYDPVTGVYIGEDEITRDLQSVVTELAGASVEIAGGIVYENIDVKIDINLEDISDIQDDIVRMSHDGTDYEVIGSPKKGIGRRNRIEFLGRSIT